MFEIFSNCKNNSRSNTATGASLYVAHFIPSIACLCLIYLVPYEVAAIFYPCFTDVKIELNEGKDTKLLVGGSGFFLIPVDFNLFQFRSLSSEQSCEML